jgi:hypothetical protein
VLQLCVLLVGWPLLTFFCGSALVDTVTIANARRCGQTTYWLYHCITAWFAIDIVVHIDNAVHILTTQR